MATSAQSATEKPRVLTRDHDCPRCGGLLKQGTPLDGGGVTYDTTARRWVHDGPCPHVTESDKPAPRPAEPSGDRESTEMVPYRFLNETDIAEVGKTTTRVVQGASWDIVPELGVPAKFVFARIAISKRSGIREVRPMISIQGLLWQASAQLGENPIKRSDFEFLDPKAVPGLEAWTGSTPMVVCRCRLELKDGRGATAHGSVRMGERSAVVKTNPLEMAEKRALARALKYALGYGGTILEEMDDAPSNGPAIPPAAKAAAITAEAKPAPVKRGTLDPPAEEVRDPRLNELVNSVEAALNTSNADLNTKRDALARGWLQLRGYARFDEVRNKDLDDLEGLYTLLDDIRGPGN